MPMSLQLQLLPAEFLQKYLEDVGVNWEEAVKVLNAKTSFDQADFEHYIQSSAVYSSNIEGNSIDIDSYLKNKRFKIKSKPKETSEIDNLVEAYNYAVANPLNQKAFMEAHKLLSRTILSLKSQRGKLRNQAVGIYSGGKLEYMAIEAENLEAEFKKLFADITTLLNLEISIAETFYYASMIHLIFEKIHPFMDGNGRAGRLLEKWFLTSKIGVEAWSIPSEEYYARHKAEYYSNIHIGVNYHQIHFARSLPFLLMLPETLI
jgi:Fic family protein